LKASFQDLTSETQQPRGQILLHNEIMSVMGLIPVVAPGTLVHISDPDDATTAVGINPDKQTMELVVTFDDDSSEEAASQMIKVRTAMRSYQRAQLDMFTEIDNMLAKTVSTLSRSDTKPFFAAPDQKQVMADLFEKYTKKMGDHRAKVFDAESALICAVNRRNLIVAQWASASDTAVSADASEFGAGSGRLQRSVQGYWVLSGLRLRFLVIGSDIMTLGGTHAGADDSDVLKLLGSVSVTTFSLQCKSSLWVSESSELAAVRAKVTADLNTIMTAFGPALAAAGPFLQQIKVDMDLSSARRNNISNVGILSSPQWEIHEHQWIAPKSLSPGDATGWETIMTQCTRMGNATGLLLSALQKINAKSEAEHGSARP
jgi:hypothetical protein